MRIKIEYYNVLFPYIDEKTIPEREIVELEYNQNTTIQDLFDNSQQCCADLSKYYDLSRDLCFNNRYFPYIISSDGNVLWNILYSDTKVADFLFTHKIQDNIIYADTGIPQAGGRGYKEVIDLWNMIYPILDQIGTLLGLSFGVIEIKRIIKTKFLDKKVAPQSVFDLLLSRTQWNHNDLSESLNLSIDDTKKLLQISGFEWDRHKRTYVLGDKKRDITEKLSKIDIYYDGR